MEKDLNTRLFRPSALACSGVSEAGGDGLTALDKISALVWEVMGEKRKGLRCISKIPGDRPGIRISPESAAACFCKEHLRTERFWHALSKAVSDVLESKGDEGEVNVLYVGCGPFATLAIPIAAFYGLTQPGRVSFHCVDAHKQSIEYAQELTGQLGISSSFATWLAKDVLDVDFKQDLQVDPDIVVMEIMDKALTSEPQAHVTHELSDFLSKRVLIPERVSVGVAFKSLSDSRFVGDVMPFVDLTREGVSTPYVFDVDEFKLVGEFAVPNKEDLQVCLVTQIGVYGDVSIEPDVNGSAITANFEIGSSFLDADSVFVHLNLCADTSGAFVARTGDMDLYSYRRANKQKELEYHKFLSRIFSNR